MTDAMDLATHALRGAGGGAFVWAVLKTAEAAPAGVAATVIALPIAIAAGTFAMAAHQSPAFVAEASLRGAQALPALLVFVVTAARLFPRLSAGPLIGTAMAAWFAAICVLTAGPAWPLGVSAAVLAAMLLLSSLALPFDLALSPPGRAAGPARRIWPVALQAALLVMVIGLFARVLGPRWSAVLTAIPVAMITVTYGLKSRGTPGWAATYQSARLAGPTLFVYLATVALAAPRWGGLAAAAAGLLPSAATAVAATSLRHRLFPRTPA
ncbi:hypothetical protein [Poseidonocella sp. HB161398]|uniref:hypothetical protein n=1 Tax=Poseidonocella sp. HB161398 TaxID=2320855 RepID=UPI0011098A3A|nr:hypothetical protein [Poseidonocella sp. HB161398]